MVQAVSGSDRRRFFRISDNIGVNYRPLAPEELDQHIESLINPSDTLTLLSDYNKQIESLLGQVALREPAVADLLSVMDKKINCVIAQLELESRLTQSLAHRVQEVNISACGMALTLDEQLESGLALDLELMLLPARLLLHCRGVVVDACPATEEDGYHTRIDFNGMAAQDQESLIQHIVKRQGVLLKALRDEEATG